MVIVTDSISLIDIMMNVNSVAPVTVPWNLGLVNMKIKPCTFINCRWANALFRSDTTKTCIRGSRPNMATSVKVGNSNSYVRGRCLVEH